MTPEEALTEIQALVEASARKHECVGFHCVVCQPYLIADLCVQGLHWKESHGEDRQQASGG